MMLQIFEKGVFLIYLCQRLRVGGLRERSNLGEKKWCLQRLVFLEMVCEGGIMGVQWDLLA